MDPIELKERKSFCKFVMGFYYLLVALFGFLMSDSIIHKEYLMTVASLLCIVLIFKEMQYHKIIVLLNSEDKYNG